MGHVGRGNNKQMIFDDILRGFSTSLLIAVEYDWAFSAWALMTNHFHLVIEVGDLGLARACSGSTSPRHRRTGVRANHSRDRYWNSRSRRRRIVSAT